MVLVFCTNWKCDSTEKTWKNVFSGFFSVWHFCLSLRLFFDNFWPKWQKSKKSQNRRFWGQFGPKSTEIVPKMTSKMALQRGPFWAFNGTYRDFSKRPVKNLSKKEVQNRPKKRSISTTLTISTSESSQKRPQKWTGKLVLFERLMGIHRAFSSDRAKNLSKKRSKTDPKKGDLDNLTICPVWVGNFRPKITFFSLFSVFAKKSKSLIFSVKNGPYILQKLKRWQYWKNLKKRVFRVFFSLTFLSPA